MGYIPISLPTSENVSPPRDVEHDKFADHVPLLLLHFLLRLLVLTMRRTTTIVLAVGSAKTPAYAAN